MSVSVTPKKIKEKKTNPILSLSRSIIILGGDWWMSLRFVLMGSNQLQIVWNVGSSFTSGSSSSFDPSFVCVGVTRDTLHLEWRRDLKNKKTMLLM